MAKSLENLKTSPTGDKIFLSKELWRRIHLGFRQKGPGIGQIGPQNRPNSLSEGWAGIKFGPRQKRFNAFGNMGKLKKTHMTVPEPFAHPIPPGLSDVEAAPLLCADAVGYRSLRLADLRDGQDLGFRPPYASS